MDRWLQDEDDGRSKEELHPAAWIKDRDHVTFLILLLLLLLFFFFFFFFWAAPVAYGGFQARG